MILTIYSDIVKYIEMKLFGGLTNFKSKKIKQKTNDIFSKAWAIVFIKII